LPELEKLYGFAGAYLLRRDDERIEIRMPTLRESLNAIRVFVGEELNHPVVEPVAQRFSTATTRPSSTAQ
jgi:hypothetical protein